MYKIRLFVARNKTTIYNNIIRNIVTLSMLPETHQMLHKTCKDFAEGELKPLATEIDKKTSLSRKTS